jgi:TolB-like protein/class 3 adenylate cyclase/Flp pilus assembly protein TadD
MAAEVKKEIQLEIAHVLCADIVGYSKLLINEQRALLDVLNQVVRGTDEFQSEEAAGRLIRIPTGDGMALVFYSSPEAPVECALEISRALKKHPQLHLRMGIHSGPVSGVVDVNEMANVAGAGVNLAQRVMDSGDAGHILLSKRAAEDLQQYPHWQPHLHDLGECEIKPGVRVHAVNLYTEELGNPEPPARFKSGKPSKAKAQDAIFASSGQRTGRFSRWLFALIIVAIAVVAAFLIFLHRPTARLDKATDTRTGVSASPAAPEKSIAVLPFTNMSTNQENAFFADGVQDEILTDLAKIADLKVISRTSVMQYKNAATHDVREIGRQLGVAHVLEGSVQRAGEKVRVIAQLIDARNDAHLWGNTYDRDLADVFAIQSEIAKSIADQLQAKLSPAEKASIEKPPTTNLPAYDLYTQAKSLLASISLGTRTKDNLLEAVRLLDQAVARDPLFLRAYCQLAYTHDNLYLLGYDHTPARRALADTAVQNALRLSPDSGEAHLALAENLYRGYLDYDGALAELAIAQRTSPNDPRVSELIGYIDRRQGRHEEGVRNLQKALELDPRNVYLLQQVSFSYKFVRRYPEEAATLDRALAILPKDIDTRVARAFVELEWRADPRSLHATVESILSENRGAAEDIADNWVTLALCERDANAAERALVALGENSFVQDAVHLSRIFGEGLVARMTHDDAKARAAFTAARDQQAQAVQEQPEYGPAICTLGLIDAALGRKEEALQEGRRAVELVPVAKDAINGVHMIEYLAIIAAWTGEKDLAFEQLAIAARLPSRVNYGQLKLHPFWDPLRGDPRFDQIVASLAPKGNQ